MTTTESPSAEPPSAEPHSAESHSHAEIAPVHFGPLESQVMEILWGGDQLTVRELIDRLPTDPAYTTIATVLSNLRKKHVVCTRKEGHHTRYQACVSRHDRAASLMIDALEESGDRAATLDSFLENLTDDDLARVAEFVARAS